MRLVTEQGRQLAEVAKELGICIDTLRSWLKATGVQLGQASRLNREQQRIRELEAEVGALRRQLAENFFSCLKCELVHLKQYSTRAAAQNDVFAYLEAFYNTVRPHSALGWIAPENFEAILCASAA